MSCSFMTFAAGVCPGPSKGDADDLDNPAEPLTRTGSGAAAGSGVAASAGAAAAGSIAAVEAAAGTAAAERVPLDEVSMEQFVL